MEQTDKRREALKETLEKALRGLASCAQIKPHRDAEYLVAFYRDFLLNKILSLFPELKVLSDEKIKAIFLTYYSKQYGEEAAQELLEELPDCNYARAIATAQRDYDQQQRGKE